MATNVEIKGSQFVYGFQTSDAPTIAHFFARKAVLKYEPETFVTATDGEGQTESVALSKADKRMITGTFSGYIEAGYSGNAIGNTFNFTVNGVSRFFLVKSINDPREKGDFANVELEVVSFALVTS